MTDKKTEALKLALSTLANARDWVGNDPEGRWDEDEMYDELCNMVKFVSEALAEQPAQPCGYPYCGCNSKAWCKLERMAENARELGLDYEPIVEQVEDSVGMGHKAWDMVDPKELAKEFHKALAEPPCKTGSQCTSKCQQCDEPHEQPHCNDCGGFDPECPLAQPTQKETK